MGGGEWIRKKGLRTGKGEPTSARGKKMGEAKLTIKTLGSGSKRTKKGKILFLKQKWKRRGGGSQGEKERKSHFPSEMGGGGRNPFLRRSKKESVNLKGEKLVSLQERMKSIPWRLQLRKGEKSRPQKVEDKKNKRVVLVIRREDERMNGGRKFTEVTVDNGRRAEKRGGKKRSPPLSKRREEGIFSPN